MSVDLDVRIADRTITRAVLLRSIECRLEGAKASDIRLMWPQFDGAISSDTPPLDLMRGGALMIRVIFFDFDLNAPPASDADDDKDGLWSSVTVVTRIEDSITLMFLTAAGIAAVTGTSIIDECRKLDGQRILTSAAIDGAIGRSIGVDFASTSSAFISAIGSSFPH